MDDLDLFEHRLALTAGGVSLFMLGHEVKMSDNPFNDGPSGNVNGRTVREEMTELRDDLLRLAAGWKPTDGDLAGAPRFEGWGVVLCEGEVLWRIIGTAHDVAQALPTVEDGDETGTMQILAIDDGFTWARDRRGFYRLGDPLRERLLGVGLLQGERAVATDRAVRSAMPPG